MTVPGRKLDVELVENDDGDLDASGAPFDPRVLDGREFVHQASRIALYAP